MRTSITGLLPGGTLLMIAVLSIWLFCKWDKPGLMVEGVAAKRNKSLVVNHGYKPPPERKPHPEQKEDALQDWLAACGTPEEYAAVVADWGRRDPWAAFAATRAESRLKHPMISAALFAAVSEEHPHDALSMIDLFTMHLSLTDPHTKRMVTGLPPDQLSVRAFMEFQRFVPWILQIPASPNRDDMALQLLDQMKETHPIQAFDLGYLIVDRHRREAFRWSATEYMEPETATNLAMDLPPDQFKDDLLSSLIPPLYEVNKARAVDAALSITDADLRNDTAEFYFTSWYRIEPEPATSWVRAKGFNKEEKKALFNAAQEAALAPQ